jgi:L-amino acid N-acyltransferase YncA
MTSAPTGPTVRAATIADADAVARIYNHYVKNTIVTFEEVPVSAADIAGRMELVAVAALPWLVAELDRQLVGYAYAARWHARAAYRFSAEVTVYVDSAHVGRRVGSHLYAALFPMLRARGIHAVLGGIALPNEASVALHERCGLEKVAHLKEVGFKLGRWIDVGYWQRTLADAP